MATNLAPVDSREVVRCDKCLLVQFRTSNDLCRRWHASLDEDEPEVVPVQLPPEVMPTNGHGRGRWCLAASIRSMLLRNGLSQRQLAARMSVPRTYVSKIENEKATPTLSSLERLARALEVTVPDLLQGGERNRQEEVRELMQDQFIAEILPFVNQLNGMQMSSILTQVRDLTVRPRRSAQQQSSLPGRSFAALRISARDSRFAHAAQAPQVFPGDQPTAGGIERSRLFFLAFQTEA